MRKRETNLSPRTKYVPFSPVREKGTKERTFVRSELMPYRKRKRDESKASIGAHSSGGIFALFAKMWLAEYRFAALIAFAQGIAKKSRLSLRNGL